MIRRFFGNKGKIRSTGSLESFSQSGEDVIIRYLLKNVLGINEISYMDIGTFHPIHLSNTYHFYLEGFSGTCFEPNPKLVETIRKVRPLDDVVNAGIGFGDQEVMADFFILNNPVLSTFSKEEAEKTCLINDNEIEEVIKIPLIPINWIFKDHIKSSPSFISIDTEGLEYEIIKSFDLVKYRPPVMCLETVSHVDEKKMMDLIELIKSFDYEIYADTFINTIFVEGHLWRNRFENYRKS